VLSQV